MAGRSSLPRRRVGLEKLVPPFPSPSPQTAGRPCGAPFLRYGGYKVFPSLGLLWGGVAPKHAPFATSLRKAAAQRPSSGGSCPCHPFRKIGTRAQFLKRQAARFGGFQERAGHPNMYDANLCTARQIFRARLRETRRADLDQTWRGGVPGWWLAPKVSPAQSGHIFVTSFFSGGHSQNVVILFRLLLLNRWTDIQNSFACSSLVTMAPF